MLKKARLLTRPALARRDAPCPKQGRSSAADPHFTFHGSWERCENAVGGLFQHPAKARRRSAHIGPTASFRAYGARVTLSISFSRPSRHLRACPCHHASPDLCASRGPYALRLSGALPLLPLSPMLLFHLAMLLLTSFALWRFHRRSRSGCRSRGLRSRRCRWNCRSRFRRLGQRNGKGIQHCGGRQ